MNIREVSDSMKLPYDELSKAIQKEEHVHCDETGTKEKGKKRWIRIGRAKNFTIFKVDPSMGIKVLLEFLGKEYSGIISCDFFVAYKTLAKKTRVNFSFARLI